MNSSSYFGQSLSQAIMSGNWEAVAASAAAAVSGGFDELGLRVAGRDGEQVGQPENEAQGRERLQQGGA